MCRGGEARFQGGIRLVRDIPCPDRDRIAVDSAAALVGQFFCTDGGVLSAVDEIRVFNPVGMYGNVTVTVDAACGLEVAVHIQGDGLRRGDLSREIDAEALFRADQGDAVCVHAADVREVDGVLRGRDACFGSDGGEAAVSCDLVAPCDDLRVIRPESCIHLDGAGIDLGAVRAACVKPLATDVDPAVLDAKPRIAA